MLKTITAGFLLFISLAANAQQILANPNEAFQAAKTGNKPVLLIFSGSDWCVPCMQLRKVLNEPSFQAFAQEHLVLLEADFPQRKRLPDSLRTSYEALAAQYNPEGLFPGIVLLDAAGKRLANIAFTRQAAAAFIADVQQHLP